MLPEATTRLKESDFSEEWDAPDEKRDALAGKRDTLAEKRDALAGKRDALAGKRDALAGKRDALAGKRDALAGKRDANGARGDASDVRGNALGEVSLFLLTLQLTESGGDSPTLETRRKFLLPAAIEVAAEPAVLGHSSVAAGGAFLPPLSRRSSKDRDKGKLLG
ncbi:hypothetical protein [Haloferula sargassicola]|uniref:Uncharacterized protein n=1 Tax=Haloferula sargassicola TaxID=490096 RepID=A0ABP9UWA0_9BACT